MKTEPKVGEVITYDYQRYKCVETNEEQLMRPCQDYCALDVVEIGPCRGACAVMRCTPRFRQDGKFVHFVKMAPRKRRHIL